MPTAFALRTDAADTFTGGVIALHDGQSYDLAEHLADGDGTIVVTDPLLEDLLDSVPVLKHVPIPEGREPESPHASRTAVDLREDLKRRQLDTSGAKADLVARLDASDAAITSGDQQAADDPNPETPGHGQQEA